MNNINEARAEQLYDEINYDIEREYRYHAIQSLDSKDRELYEQEKKKREEWRKKI